ncbi:DUF3068 domain-containing protein [Actinomadura soli]|uniref:DUF3068 domain-containing protein n=1 Tax=Actinomadura soli TaxID=2508997 RepID=A0A5C4JE88_9ACTN|nr:DUF3068 domain-containing protein [Actinomadura soli]TMR01936.1 DUF3068 domain-containing protein [Actinomadura soli]
MRRTIGFTLIGIGAFMLAGFVLARYYIAPTLIGAPTDFYQVTRLRADGASYFDAGRLTPRTGATVTATNTIRADVKAQEDGVAVWDSTTVIEDTANGVTIELQKQRLAFDRRTARLTNCCGAAVENDKSVRQSGIGLFWPVEVEKKGLQLFDTGTRRAWPITFAGEERRNGVRTYRFVQSVPDTKIPSELPAVPPELLGLPKGGAPVQVDRYQRSDSTYWIDPRTGAPIDQQRHVVSTLRPQQGGAGSLVVADLDLRMTPESRMSLLAKSDDGAAKIRLLETIVPLTFLGAGLFALAAGLALTTGSGRLPRHRGALGGSAAPASR